MTITKLVNITGKGNVLLCDLNDKERESPQSIIGAKVRFKGVEYTVREVECSRPLMDGMPFNKSAGLVVGDPQIPEFEDGYYWRKSISEIILIRSGELFRMDCLREHAISNHSDSFIFDHKDIGERVSPPSNKDQ